MPIFNPRTEEVHSFVKEVVKSINLIVEFIVQNGWPNSKMVKVRCTQWVTSDQWDEYYWIGIEDKLAEECSMECCARYRHLKFNRHSNGRWYVELSSGGKCPNWPIVIWEGEGGYNIKRDQLTQKQIATITWLISKWSWLWRWCGIQLGMDDARQRNFNTIRRRWGSGFQ